MYWTAKSTFVGAIGLLALATGVRGEMVLTLSDLSSDETTAEDLDARLVFEVVGDALTLTAINDTLPPAGFDITAIYFNASPKIAGLSLAPSLQGWDLHTNRKADGFGRFDFAIISDLGNDPLEIAPQDSLTFTLAISGQPSVAVADFTSDFSTIPPGDHPVLAAVKFQNGPGDDSAFGGVVPEPGTLLLAMLGVTLLGRRRRPRPG
jgi:hypothetical protein